MVKLELGGMWLGEFDESRPFHGLEDARLRETPDWVDRLV